MKKDQSLLNVLKKLLSLKKSGKTWNSMYDTSIIIM